ncbi:extensin [Cryptomeria japonica]|uniref:extensin n=1 Tax=Cryptomeria japonica TaxID=3369 RepID=UPI0025AC8AF0|nr:extensin [Cryptomeria japonica]
MASKAFYVAPMLLLGILILFVSTFASASSRISYEEGIQKPNSVVVKGSVFCETQLSENAYFLSGALVAVECSISSNRKWKTTSEMVSVEGETNEDGEFRVEIPIIHNLNPGRSCSVRLVSSPHESCNIPSISESTQLILISSDSSGIQTYASTPLSYSPSQQVIITSIPHRRVLQLPSIPPLPKVSLPPLPSIPPLPKLSVPPLPSNPNVVAPPLPKLSFPPLPNAPSFPKLSVPPLPSVPTLPKLSVPPLPSVSPLPKLSVPPLPSTPLPNLSVPPLSIPNPPPVPKISFPPLPPFTQPPLPSFNFPPFPFFTPPPPSN